MANLEELLWCEPRLIEDIRGKRKEIPTTSGVYLFTSHCGKVRRNTGVLYIGKAKSLRKRLSSYLASPFETLLLSPRKKDGSLSRSLRHTGKNLLLMDIQQKSKLGESGMWLRSLETKSPAILEKELISFY